MTYTRKRMPIIFDYSVGNCLLERCSTFKDLGILYDQKLSFNSHIESVTKSSLKMLGFINRTCKEFAGVDAQKTLYISFVRSKLEYGAIIWCPYYHSYINQLESIQRKFLKTLAYHCDNTYPARGIDQSVLLQRFNMPSLVQRREYLALQFLYKICRNIIDCPELNCLLNIQVPTRSTRRQTIFYIPRTNTNILTRSPMQLMCTLFNKYSKDIDLFHLNMHKFKNITKELIFS
jgi:hypothetical protein